MYTEQEIDTTHEDDDEVVAQLRDYEVPDDLLERVRNERMLRKDYTQKRQQESAELAQLREQVAYLAGRLQDGGDRTRQEQDELDEFLSQLEQEASDDDSKRIVNVLKEVGKRAKQSALKEFQREVAPVRQQQLTQQADSRLRSYYESDLKAKYGPEVMNLITPQVHEAFVKLYVQNGNIDPEGLLNKHFDEQMFDLKAKARAAKQKQQQSKHSEGMTDARRTTPPQAGRREPKQDSGNKIFNPADLLANIRRRAETYRSRRG